MEQALATSQASYEIQPRVFTRTFRNFVLYVQDVRSGTGAANWRQVFMADVTDPNPRPHHHRRLRHRGQRHTQELLMRLRDGSRHETVSPASRNSTTSPPLLHRSAPGPEPAERSPPGALDTAIYALPMNALLERTHGPDGKRFLIELHSRFAYPAACLVLMLVGVPLGVASRRGGKSSGFVFTILLVLLYYILSYTGIALGRRTRFPPSSAVWSANLLFAAAGIFLLWQMASGGRVLNAITSWAARAPKPEVRTRAKPMALPLAGLFEQVQPRFQRAKARNVFPRILDEYVVREFLNTFFLVLAGFVMLMLVFTFFELVGDILRNHIPCPRSAPIWST
jgi:lipopolysaccharide export LptBFGC system permease protein LptF